MLLFAVVAEIRLRTRRPGVRISPGAPLFPSKTLEISRFGRLGACPSEASRFKRAGQGAARCSQQETRRCGEATAEVALGRSAEPCCRRNSGAWSFSRTLASNVSTTTHFCFVAEDSDMATSVNRRSASSARPRPLARSGAQQCIPAHAMRSRSVTESVTVLAERAPVAQLDRVPAFEAGCCRFESDRARHEIQKARLSVFYATCMF